MVGAIISLLSLGDLRHHVLPYVIIASSATLILYLGVYLFKKHQVCFRARDLFLVALLFRAVALPLGPSLSDDAWRYLWDGRLLLNGVNPYHHVPADSALSDFHDDLFALQGYPETNTIYPPVAQLIFAGSIALAQPFGEDPLVGYYIWKLFLIAAEMLALWLLLLLLKRMRLPLYGAALYAWHPLVVIEIAGQGHTDALWVLALGLALFGYTMGRAGGGVAGLGFGVGVRLFPLITLPVWLRFLDRRRAIVGGAIALPLVLTLALFLDPEVFNRYATVATRFTNFYEFNGGFYHGVKWLLDELMVKPSNRIAGGITTGLMLLGVVAITLWPIKRRTLSVLLSRVLGIVTLQIALSAKVHIWYFVVPLFLLALRDDRRLSLAWYWVALIAPLTYLYYATEPFQERALALWLEWGGMAFLILLGFLITWISRRKPKAKADFV